MTKSLFYQERGRLLFIMRVTLINILISAILITVSYAEDVNGQGVLDRKVTLILKGDVMIKDVLSEIESKAQVKFTYRPKVVKAKKKISIEVFNAPIHQILDKMFDSEIAYEAIGEQIVLTPTETDAYDGSARSADAILFAVSGTITDENGTGLPGVNIIEKGTANGTTSDANGAYAINVADENAVLILSFIGYQTQEISVGGRSTVDVQMALEAKSLEEVVVVGYGEQSKRVVTGAISQVSSAALEKVPNGFLGTALQGRVSGVTIAQNSGQPGSDFTVRVRGVTSFNGGNNPLYVVDGVVVNPEAMHFLNQADIESLEILKDATSAAIYGTRAAAGVILITTKKGKSGKLVVDYNGFVGTSGPARKLDMLNASQYAMIMNERSIGGGGPIIYDDPASLGKGTDWQSLIFSNHAHRVNHQISLSGGNDKSTFFTSIGYQNTEGIVATDISSYERFNVRLNSTHKISKVFTVTQTLGYAHGKSKGLGNTNSEYGGPLSSAINLFPTTPVYETDPAVVAGYMANDTVPPVSDSHGNYYSISNGVQEMSNPLAYIKTRLGRYGWDDNLIGNLSVEAAVTKDIKVKSIVSGKLSMWGDQGFAPASYLGSGGGLNTTQNSMWKNTNHAVDWNVENYITYSKRIGDHDFSVLVGQGAYVSNVGGGNSFSFQGLPVNNYKDASFGYYNPASSPFNASAYTTDGNLYNNVHKLSSLFARANYNYREKYLLTAIIRRDGSNRFGANYRYGTFPGVSAGWNIDQESFWPRNNIVNTFKLRGGFGVTGSDGLPDYKFLSLVAVGENYTIGDNVSDGYAPLTLENPDLHWEETTQTNIGFETTLLNNLDLTFDFFSKKTSGILRQRTIPGYVGVTELPWANIADMENKGIEMEIKYSRDLGPVHFTGSGVFSTLKNTVTYVSSENNWYDGDASFQTMSTVTRTQVGQSYNAWFGYKTNGIFQTQADIDNYTNKDGEPLQPDAKPGDFRWVDVNGDGKITTDDQDKAFLGTNLPKYTFGITLNFEYKGFDFMIFANGVAGNKIFQGLRRLDISKANYQTAVLGRWTGPGTSNDYPRLSTDDPNGNFSRMSDFYLQKGDFLRFRIVQLGYTLPQNDFMNKLGVSKFRVYITGENLFTFTKYTGYDPEIGGGNVFGVDKGQYPQARSFLFGAQIQL